MDLSTSSIYLIYKSFRDLDLIQIYKFERFQEYYRAKQHIMYIGWNYKNAYKWTIYWEDDHNDNDNC